MNVAQKEILVSDPRSSNPFFSMANMLAITRDKVVTFEGENSFLPGETQIGVDARQEEVTEEDMEASVAQRLTNRVRNSPNKDQPIRNMVKYFRNSIGDVHLKRILSQFTPPCSFETKAIQKGTKSSIQQRIQSRFGHGYAHLDEASCAGGKKYSQVSVLTLENTFNAFQKKVLGPFQPHVDTPRQEDWQA